MYQYATYYLLKVSLVGLAYRLMYNKILFISRLFGSVFVRLKNVARKVNFRHKLSGVK